MNDKIIGLKKFKIYNMDIPLHTYEPVNQNFLLVWLAFGVFIISALGAFWLFRQDTQAKGSQYNGLLGMLMGFMALISLGTGIFGWLSTTKTGTVNIYENRIELGSQVIEYQNIDNAKIEVSRETSWINPNITKRSVRLLFIADKNGNTYVLSEENYPIETIMANLRAAIAN